jgi:hypothetical protein
VIGAITRAFPWTFLGESTTSVVLPPLGTFSFFSSRSDVHVLFDSYFVAHRGRVQTVECLAAALHEDLDLARRFCP